ncbi:MAG: hypothetical protein U0S50_11030 [Sphingopyxis sp.]|uniref:hypothetical protein n=1 Tax=Sphingopyxis sp. TaxID=1908224 RepID=UPI002ABC771E|nr:hypothetical protein [Sphingopyxis sp.]MDZ3832339.1 hypothetical protein [Sphingopyxis sp.]
MRQEYPLALHHSWPLFDQARHFDLGWVDRTCVRPLDPPQAPLPIDDAALARRGVGVWRCDLADNRLSWSPVVYDIFGVPRGSSVARAEAVSFYCEGSRAAMERLRAYAIAHRRGFTLDVEIGPALPRPRWMRLVAAPRCEGDKVVGLHGLKWLLPPGGA